MNNCKIPKLKVGDQWIHNQNQISEKLNNYFGNVGKIQARKINSSINHNDFRQNIQPNSMVLYLTSQLEVENLLSRLPNKKSSGLDKLPNIAFKIIANIISKPLSDLINASFIKSTFPDCLKHAKIIPIHKAGAKFLPKNYRSISLLKNMSKILEILMNNRLVNFLESYNIIIKEQFGFLKHHSTENALTALTDDIYENLDNKKMALSIFIDLKKAFDTVSHDILFSKLENNGIRGNTLKWFKSYLKNRTQSTEANNILSNEIPITWGLPQGGNLSPILYLIYVNDIIHYSDNRNGNLILFADDTSITFYHENIEQLYSIANNELSKLNKWFESLKLSMNLLKTKYMVFSSQKKKSDNPTRKIKLGITDIEKTEVYKYLGCFISSNMKWNEHISYLKTKVSKLVPMLYRIRFKLTIRNKIMLYNSIIKPHLQYAIGVYCKTSEQNMNVLQRLQNKTLKVLFYKRRNENIDTLYREHKILNMKDLAKFQTLQPIHNYLKQGSKTPVKIAENLRKFNWTNNRSNLRNHYNFTTMRCRTELGKKHSYTNTSQWNSLPNELKVINSTSLFKSKLKKYFTSLYQI